MLLLLPLLLLMLLLCVVVSRGCGLLSAGRQGPGAADRGGEDCPAGSALPRHQHQDPDPDQGVQGVQGNKHNSAFVQKNLKRGPTNCGYFSKMTSFR